MLQLVPIFLNALVIQIVVYLLSYLLYGKLCTIANYIDDIIYLAPC
jgi:hypothetical protein